MLIRLSEDEKRLYCVKLGEHMKRLRAIVGFTQEDLSSLSGISKERISRIENGAFVMKWTHFISFTMVFSMNTSTKEYMVATKILTPRLLQALQMKDEQIPPDIFVPISDSLANDFQTDFKIVNSLSSGFAESNEKGNK